MANIKSVHSVAESIITYLKNAYPFDNTDDNTAYPCEFRVLSSGELAEDPEFANNGLSLYLYRIIVNEHTRNRPLKRAPNDSTPPLSLDLHFLLSVWAKGADAEHIISAWAMNQLHHHPIMDNSSLNEHGEWTADEVVHIIPAELSNEDLMRIWDAISPSYRLSVSYIARVVRIDPEDDRVGLPLVATRYEYIEGGDGE